MAKLLLFKSRRRVEEEASLWLSRMDRGLDAASQAALEAWVAEDVRHARALVAMAALWDDMDLLRELSGLLELPARADPRAATPRWLWVGVGTAVPAALLAGWLLLQRDPSSHGMASTPSVAGVVDAMVTPVEGPAAASPVRDRLEFATAVGERRTEVLPDGSIVQLNTATRVALSYDPAVRGVEVIGGEAHFEVQPDPGRPFVVVAGDRRIRAVGTAFNVRLERDGRLEVTVTEGRIVVTGSRSAGAQALPDGTLREARVDAGERLLADVADSQWRVQRLLQETLSSRLAWQRGMLVFDGEPLEAALAEVSRYTDVRFEIRDDVLRRMRVGGFYKSGDIDGLVRSLEQNLGIVATRGADGQIVLTAR